MVVDSHGNTPHHFFLIPFCGPKLAAWAIHIRTLLKILEKVARAIGDIITLVILTIFYFTVFALFAIPYRLFADPLHRKPRESTWSPVTNTYSLEWFKREF